MKGLIAALLILFAAPLAMPAYAHPEDELCTPDGGLDPELCRALSQIDKAGPPKTSTPGVPDREAALQLNRCWAGTLAFYVSVGFKHILPLGLDHLLFVMALILSSRRVRPLLLQISAFTLAHTLTLALSASGAITPLPALVEPLIALTIVWAAAENLIFKDAQIWRPLLVFAFGLVHGLGFAGVFAEQELPAGVFWPALIGFNLGVEAGQLAVMGMSLAVIEVVRRLVLAAGWDWNVRRVIVWPVSLAIGAFGLWWAIERAFL